MTKPELALESSWYVMSYFFKIHTSFAYISQLITAKLEMVSISNLSKKCDVDIATNQGDY